MNIREIHEGEIGSFSKFDMMLGKQEPILAHQRKMKANYMRKCRNAAHHVNITKDHGLLNFGTPNDPTQHP